MMRTYDGMGIYATRTDCDKEGNDLTLGIEGEFDFLMDENEELLLDESGKPIMTADSDARIVTIGNLPIQCEQLVITLVQRGPDDYTVDTDYATVYAAYQANTPIKVVFRTASTIWIPAHVVLVNNTYIELQGITYPDDIDNTPAHKGTRWVYAFTAYIYKNGRLETHYVEHQVIPEPDADELQPIYAVWGRRRNQWVNARAIESVDVAAVSGDVTPVVNNCFNNITGTIPATLTLDCVPITGEIANFAAQITAGATDSTLVVTVNGQPTKYTKVPGNCLEAGKTYQVSCLNDCWTMAEFETPI